MCASGLKKVLIAVVIITNASSQWRTRAMNMNIHSQPQRRFAEQSSQQPSSQQWNNNYPSSSNQWNNMHNMNMNMHQQQQQQWDGNLQKKQPYQQRQQNLVDYPFTVEYVDRRRQNRIGGLLPTSRKGVGSNLQHDDENLIDYPFTIEYVNRNRAENQENRPQASFHSNQDSFQFKTQQQPYQQSNQHRHSGPTHNDNPSRVW